MYVHVESPNIFVIWNSSHLAGFFPQIWPHSAGLGTPQESCKPDTTPGGAFSRALKS